MCRSLRTYTECNAFLEEQIAMTRTVHIVGKTKGKKKDSELDALLARVQELKDKEKEEDEESEEESPNDKAIEEVEAQLYALKGGGGKSGGGKGNKGGQWSKGGTLTLKFDGICHHCQKWGHRVRDCWSKDREMEQIRNSGVKGQGK